MTKTSASRRIATTPATFTDRVARSRWARAPSCDAGRNHCLRKGVWFAANKIERGRLFRATPSFVFEKKWYDFVGEPVDTSGKLYKTKPVGNDSLSPGQDGDFFSSENDDSKWADSEYEALTSSRWEAGVVESASARRSRISGWGEVPKDTIRVITQTKTLLADERQQALGIVGLDPVDAERDEALRPRASVAALGAIGLPVDEPSGNSVCVPIAMPRSCRRSTVSRADERVLGADDARAEQAADDVAVEDAVEQAPRVRVRMALVKPEPRLDGGNRSSTGSRSSASCRRSRSPIASPGVARMRRAQLARIERRHDHAILGPGLGDHLRGDRADLDRPPARQVELELDVDRDLVGDLGEHLGEQRDRAPRARSARPPRRRRVEAHRDLAADPELRELVPGQVADVARDRRSSAADRRS